MAGGDLRRPEPRGLPQLTVAVGLMAMALLIALAFLLYSRAQDSLEDRAESQVRGATTLAAQLVGEQMRRFAELVDARAAHLTSHSDAPLKTLTRAQRREAATALRELRERTRGVRGAGLASIDGRLLLVDPPRPELVGQSFAYRDWFKGVTQERSPYVSRVFRSVAPGRPKSVTVAALVRARDRTPIAILTVGLERRTQELVTEFNRTQGLGLVVTDQAGGVVALSGVRSNRIMSLKRDPLVQAALGGKSGTQVDDTEIAGYAPVPDIGWTVSARLPTEIALEDVHDLRTLTIVLTGTIGLLLVALTSGVLWFQRRVQRLQFQGIKRQQAVHLHDGVVQTLTVALIARQAGDDAAAERAVAEALAESKRITAALLPENVEPGDLVQPD